MSNVIHFRSPRRSLSGQGLILAVILAVCGLLGMADTAIAGATSIPSCPFLSPAVGLSLGTATTTQMVERHSDVTSPSRTSSPVYQCDVKVKNGFLGITFITRGASLPKYKVTRSSLLFDPGFKAKLTTTAATTSKGIPFDETVRVYDAKNHTSIAVIDFGPGSTRRQLSIKKALRVANAVLRAGPEAPGVKASARLTAQSK